MGSTSFHVQLWDELSSCLVKIADLKLPTYITSLISKVIRQVEMTMKIFSEVAGSGLLVTAILFQSMIYNAIISMKGFQDKQSVSLMPCVVLDSVSQ